MKELTFELNPPGVSKITWTALIGLLLSAFIGPSYSLMPQAMPALSSVATPAIYLLIWVFRVFGTARAKHPVTGATLTRTNDSLYFINTPMASKIQWTALISAIVHAAGESLIASSGFDEASVRGFLGLYDKVAFAAIAIFRVWFTGAIKAKV